MPVRKRDLGATRKIRDRRMCEEGAGLVDTPLTETQKAFCSSLDPG